MEKDGERTLGVIRRLEPHRPDLLEIRFDLMRNTAPIAQIRRNTDLPLIATNRRRGDGGFYQGSEEHRMDTLSKAAQQGFDFVDIELNAKNAGKLVRRFEQEGARIIVSHHNSKSTPQLSTLESILKRERNAGAYICKLVTTAKSYADNVRCFQFLSKHARRTRLVCFAMGRLGVPSRVLSPVFGAYFTFASAGVGNETATGQIPLSTLREFYKELRIA
jgi:3-dehydroquinate dehydratase type I